MELASFRWSDTDNREERNDVRYEGLWFALCGIVWILEKRSRMVRPIPILTCTPTHD